MRRFLATTLGVLLPASGLLMGQADTSAAQTRKIAEQLVQTIRVPIHTAPPANGVAYGVWAAGPNYKVSFHDGFAFYPVLGTDYPENLPLRWRTEGVTIGGTRVFAEESRPMTAHTDWRFEYRYPGFVEAYDVRTDGVEQTFTLLERPARTGDLVVVGRMAGPLTADDCPTAHAALTFDGPKGEPVVRYGEAFALDGRGAKTSIATTCDGDRITLRLPAAWLEGATFPVTIDPLISSVALTGTYTRPFLQVDMSAPAAYSTTVNIAYSLSVSASDSDAYLLRVNSNLTSPVVLFSDVTTYWKTPTVALAHALYYEYKWPRTAVVLVMQRDFALPNIVPTSGIAWHINRGAFDTRSANLVSYGIARRRPDVGGLDGSYTTSACVVWEQDTSAGGANTPYTEVYAASLGLTSPYGVSGMPFVVASSPVGNRWDREFPSISESAPWVVVYQERASTGSQYAVHASMLTASLSNSGRTSFPVTTGVPYARVGGASTRFLVAYRDGSSCGARRLDWNPGFQLGAFKAFPFAGWVGAVAFDTDTRSHFCVTTSGRPPTSSSWVFSPNYFYRLGHSGGIVEQGFVGSGGTAATTPAAYLAKHPLFSGEGAFVLAYQRHTFSWWTNYYSLLGRRLAHDSSCGNFLYGTGCAGRISAPTRPYAGLDQYTVKLDQTSQSGQTAWLYVSAFPASIYISPGCYLNVSSSAIVAFHSRPLDAWGRASVTFSLPDDPVFLGNYYMQWIWSNGAGTWYLSRGLRAQVRP